MDAMLERNWRCVLQMRLFAINGSRVIPDRDAMFSLVKTRELCTREPPTFINNSQERWQNSCQFVSD